MEGLAAALGVAATEEEDEAETKAAAAEAAGGFLVSHASQAVAWAGLKRVHALHDHSPSGSTRAASRSRLSFSAAASSALLVLRLVVAGDDEVAGAERDELRDDVASPMAEVAPLLDDDFFFFLVGVLASSFLAFLVDFFSFFSFFSLEAVIEEGGDDEVPFSTAPSTWSSTFFVFLAFFSPLAARFTLLDDVAASMAPDEEDDRRERDSTADMSVVAEESIMLVVLPPLDSLDIDRKSVV